ncbi:MAG: hypothetical protein M3Z22_04555 [Verrucomicrobiota bacterium]|nr:hypothetical protein [Verrucomicrobiota bacterium]
MAIDIANEKMPAAVNGGHLHSRLPWIFTAPLSVFYEGAWAPQIHRQLSRLTTAADSQ